MHREINKTPDGILTDHINRDGLDNRRENLRNATSSQNLSNQKSKTGTSRFKGVYWAKERNMWRSNIRINKKTKHLGEYICEIVAAAVYDDAAEKHFGEFARTNF